jgi:glycosyltransferase involved in cell wall biosynthesis
MKLSIITVVLNDAAHIESTIQSVINQNFNSIQYIVIDGQSTDGTLDILKKYSNYIDVLISEKDRGIYDAMNKGLKLAKGDYVLFLNSGDMLYDSQTISKIFASSPEADVYYGDIQIITPDGTVRGLRRLRPPENLTWKSLRRGMLVSHQAFIPRRDLCPPYDLKYRFSADYDWMIKVLRQANTIINTHQIIIKYLDGGLTKQNLIKSLKERFIIMKQNYGLIPTVVQHIGFSFRLGYFYIKNKWF